MIRRSSKVLYQHSYRTTYTIDMRQPMNDAPVFLHIDVDVRFDRRARETKKKAEIPPLLLLCAYGTKTGHDFNIPHVRCVVFFCDQIFFFFRVYNNTKWYIKARAWLSVSLK